MNFRLIPCLSMLYFRRKITMEIIAIESQAFNAIIKKIESIKDELAKNKNQLLSDEWLDNADVCGLLKISSRTLQNLRDRKAFPFTKKGKKIYYKASDIQTYLEDGYNGKEN